MRKEGGLSRPTVVCKDFIFRVKRELQGNQSKKCCNERPVVVSDPLDINFNYISSEWEPRSDIMHGLHFSSPINAALLIRRWCQMFTDGDFRSPSDAEGFQSV